MLFYTILYDAILYCTRPYFSILYHTTPYHTIPYHTIPYHTIPYHTIPYHTIPYHAVLYFTLPYCTIPCHCSTIHQKGSRMRLESLGPWAPGAKQAGQALQRTGPKGAVLCLYPEEVCVYVFFILDYVIVCFCSSTSYHIILHYIILHSILFYSVLFYSTVFYYIMLYFTCSIIHYLLNTIDYRLCYILSC